MGQLVQITGARYPREGMHVLIRNWGINTLDSEALDMASCFTESKAFHRSIDTTNIFGPFFPIYFLIILTISTECMCCGGNCWVFFVELSVNFILQETSIPLSFCVCCACFVGSSFFSQPSLFCGLFLPYC